MYKLTKSAKSNFIKIMGYTPDENEIKIQMKDAFCVQFFKVIKPFFIRPEVYFNPQSELCFVCDRRNKKIIAIYKASKYKEKEEGK